MNNKEKLKEILLLSIFILNDKQYKEITYLLDNNKFNIARVLVDDLLETKEIDIIGNSNNQKYVYEYRQLDKLHNLIIDLIVNEEVDERETQFEQNIKQQ